MKKINGYFVSRHSFNLDRNVDFSYDKKIMEITIDKKVMDDIREFFSNAWNVNHEGESGKSHIRLGKRNLAIMIPRAPYQAELDLIKRSGSTRALSRYL